MNPDRIQWQFQWLDFDLYEWSDWIDCDEEDAVEMSGNQRFKTRYIRVPANFV